MWKCLDYGAESHLCFNFEEADASTHRTLLICKDFLTTPSQGIVLGGDASLGQRVEKGGLAHVGQAHDAAFEAHGFFLKYQCTTWHHTAVVEVPDPHWGVFGSCEEM